MNQHYLIQSKNVITSLCIFGMHLLCAFKLDHLVGDHL